MKVEKMNPLGVRLLDFDVSNPDHVDVFADAFLKHSLVIFNDPDLSPEDHVMLMDRVGSVAADRHRACRNSQPAWTGRGCNW